VIEAKLVRNTEGLGKMDPFVEIEYLDKKYKTNVVCDAGFHPIWDMQSFDIHVEGLGDPIKFSCYDEDPLANDLVGDTSMVIGTLCMNHPIDKWFVIEYTGKKSGEIHI